MTANEQAPSEGVGWVFNHLPKILWQRRLFVLVPFLLLTALAILFAWALPTLYRSQASLLVQSQELSTDLVRAPTPGAIEQRIARIRERVLSRGDLIQLIEQNNLYAEERRSQPLSEVVEKMRDSTIVGAVANDLGTAGGPADTIAIEMSFDYPSPAQAQLVLQSFVNSFLSQDNEDISDQARLSVRFLEDQANKLRSQITALENQLTSLKARNGAALATSNAPPMVDLGSYSTQIASLESQNRQLLAQASRPAQKDPQLAAAEANLAAAEALYNESHPDVRAARERLRAVQQMVRVSPQSDDAALVRSQIAANNSAIASLQAARSQAMARASASMAGSARAPAILEEAMQLENQASGLREQYRSVSEDLLKAQNSARLANEQRAERLSLVEPPSLPDQPYSPNRPLLIAGGAIAGLLLGLLLAFAVEFIRRPLRSPTQLENLGLPVLGVVPLLEGRLQKKKGLGLDLIRRKARVA